MDGYIALLEEVRTYQVLDLLTIIKHLHCLHELWDRPLELLHGLAVSL